VAAGTVDFDGKAAVCAQMLCWSLHTGNRPEEEAEDS